LDRYLMQPGILKAFGWRFALVLTKDWYHTPEDVLGRIEKLLEGKEESGKQTAEMEEGVEEEDENEEAAVAEPVQPAAPVAAAKPRSVAAPPVVAPPVVTPPVAVKGVTRKFEFVGGGSQKFWEITVAGNSFTVRFGRIGTAGQAQTKTFADEAKAKREAEGLIAEKVKKGYEEKS